MQVTVKVQPILVFNILSKYCCTVNHHLPGWWLSAFTCTLARTTSMGLVMVEAVAAAIGPAKACRIRWGHSLGASKDSCSGNAKDTKKV